MRYQAIILSTVFILFMVTFQVSAVSAFSAPGATYYVDINHPNGQDSNDHGSLNRPWKTLKYALQQLKSGDTLLIKRGTYPGAWLTLRNKNSGTAAAPITVKAAPGETVIWRSTQERILIFQGASHWIFEDIIFEGQGIILGQSKTTIAKHITFRNCLFRDSSTRPLLLSYAENILIEDSHFQRIQSQKAGRDLTALNIPYYADNIIIRNSKFEDISSDGIQLGAFNVKVTNVTIENNEFWINNPDQVFLGENAVDVKRVQGPIYIRGNIIHGFRPTVPGQNASGAKGVGVVLHSDAENIILEKNLFYDNTTHLAIDRGSKGTPGGNRNIMIRNNIFRDARMSDRTGTLQGGIAIQVFEAAQVQIYHNTFYNNKTFLSSNRITGGIFKNNIVFKGGIKITTSSEWKGEHNAWAQIEGNIPSSLQADSNLFVSNLRLREDLRPQPNSPIINAGQNVNVMDDFDGHPRIDGLPDLGAFEYRLSSSSQIFLPFVANNSKRN